MYNIKSSLNPNIRWYPPGSYLFTKNNTTGNQYFNISGGWVFWDETQSNFYGPYNTEEECYDKLIGYIKTLKEEFNEKT